MWRCPLALMLVLGVSACKVGPNYVKPDIADITPAKWKWQVAEPKDDQPRGEWWRVFGDAELNRLQALAVANNNDLRAAVARVDQARSVTKAAGLALSPDVNLNAAAQRERTSGNLPSPVPVAIPSSRINTFNVPIELAYELDFWGRVRRSIESSRADAEVVMADYHGVLLTLNGDVAMQYFLVRSYDMEMATLRKVLETREQSIGVLKQRFDAGAIPEADYARAQSEVATSKAEMADVRRLRAEAVGVLALLCGQSASNFEVKSRASLSSPPLIPAGLPASLLERRPDVGGAERQVAARNADIGVEVAGYFPKISLTGSGGFLSKDTQSLFTADSKVWSIGPSVSVPVTGMLVIKARVQRARGLHAEAVAVYRQAVLGAIQDVETSLSQIRFRGEQSAAMDEAVAASERAMVLTRQRYDSGALGYLELLDVERTNLSVSRQAAQVKAQRLISTVRLIKALGGSW
ncbi:efflux transporter outer membrane subunit [Phragmitibacter flavus]|uniref:Efflux transporter outer membrane subunit n=1 Tax=Phragmitibacter flavus TaxID=2576071 RepID=A0A5R8K8K1_9BACT|nr:efflux transporter outer membrane subunit [Phragmitibacter flavus]TLD68285.1 efflux transporter outer membrane subunit [Phragmitibacter flavus]